MSELFMAGAQLIEAIILGVVQGIAEFLPISSSGHLVIVKELLQPFFGEDLDRAGSMELNVALHVGTLFSILVVYWRDLKQLPSRPRVIMAIGVATLPVVVVGLTCKEIVKKSFEVPLVAGVGLLITAGLLVAGQRWERGDREVESMPALTAIYIGLFQALAIVPGISRSGSTIAGGLFCGLRRDMSATFSFLIAIPAISGAGVLSVKDVLEGQASENSLLTLCVGAFTSFAVGYFALRWLLKLVSKRRLHLFAIYCATVGTSVIIWQLFLYLGSVKP